MSTINTTKKQILIDGVNECIKHHLCGNYISVADIDGLDSTDIEWNIDVDTLQILAYTDFGVYRYDYDYYFSFDENLNTFVEGLQEFLVNKVDNN